MVSNNSSQIHSGITLEIPLKIQECCQCIPRIDSRFSKEPYKFLLTIFFAYTKNISQNIGLGNFAWVLPTI